MNVCSKEYKLRNFKCALELESIWPLMYVGIKIIHRKNRECQKSQNRMEYFILKAPILWLYS